MTNNNSTPANQRFDRPTVITLLTHAVNVESLRFARNLASVWLETFPGDLVIEHLLAQAYIKQEKVEKATPLIKGIVYSDPEYLPAQRLLAYSSSFFEYTSVATAQQCILSLGGSVPHPDETLTWSKTVKAALEQQKTGNLKKADVLFREAISRHPDTPLVAVLHLKLAAEKWPLENLLALAETYSQRWPDSIACMLIHADALLKSGREEQAVNLLHQAAALDIGGQVAVRLWGTQHSYTNIWPVAPEITVDLPIPADVATAMGWNQLNPGEPIETQSAEAASKSRKRRRSAKSIAESKQVVNSARQELEELAIRIKKPVLGSTDGRFPAYIILTTRSGLEAQYGSGSLGKIDLALKNLEAKTKALPGWNAYLIYADDAVSTDKFSLPPAIAKDPWSIKNLISDLDTSLKSKGERIGALLLVGGDKVVPFHLLPNPLDDFDTQVPSDNPYASNDENYFIPLWPIGRLPGSAAEDPAALLTQINKIGQNRQTSISPSANHPWMLRLFQRVFMGMLGKRKARSFGYSAEVWRRASHAVYRSIGKPHHLKVSPPVSAAKIAPHINKGPQLAYYNLHGLQDTAEWYGQKDPVEGQLGPDYPVALRPQDIKNSGRAPRIVFSEACFGANIIQKSVEEAICLKFLDSGSQAVIGSTCTSYGSIKTPLIAADLLGKAFWNFLQQGYPAGESLRRAKIHLAKEMNKRQGYLDGEDQKTLISFVLYGDPLAQSNLTDDHTLEKSAFSPAFNPDRIKTVCDKVNPAGTDEIPQEMIKQVKGIVEHYLPGMENANLLYAKEHVHCEGHACEAPNRVAGTNAKQGPSRQVVTLRKEDTYQSKTHARHARITFSAEGKVTKLAVSR